MPGFLEAVGDRLAFEPPFAKECLAAGFALRRGFGIDHVAVILGQFVMHMLGSMAEKVAMLVHGAPLDRQGLAPERDKRGLKAGSTVDDDELGPSETTRIKVIEEGPPSGLALAAHFPDGKKHLLVVLAHADGRQHRGSWPSGPAGS